MLILLDTNILLRSAKADDPHRPIVQAAVIKMIDADHQLTTVPQCCYEYFVVATRPVANNGLGLEPSQAVQDLEQIIERFQMAADSTFQVPCPNTVRHCGCWVSQDTAIVVGNGAKAVEDWRELLYERR
jgi:predicted nucleic acid-binding protein